MPSTSPQRAAAAATSAAPWTAAAGAASAAGAPMRGAAVEDDRIVAAALPGPYPPPDGPRKLSTVVSFSISSIAPAMAVIFTNPFDTAKVRLQLQGERLKQAAKAGGATQPGAVVYRNSFDCMLKTFRMEGVAGLQKGLSPAILREGSKNLFRLGMYDPVINAMHPKSVYGASPPPPWKLMAAGAICGAMGALACNPFELVKTRLQSSAHGSLAVGHQHGYTGVWMGLRTIVSQEGVNGLYRGSAMSVGRSIVGSGANLSAFHMLKDYLMDPTGPAWDDGVKTDMVAGMASGLASVICMNPIDVLRTRYYNQPYVNGRGTIYASGWDAARTVVGNEGWGALYKGFSSHFLRIGPHFCLTFVFLGVLRRAITDLQDTRTMTSTFSAFDRDGDGVLNVAEVARAVRFAMPSEPAPVVQAITERLMQGSSAVSATAFAGMTEELRAEVRAHAAAAASE
ncbi:hypothetical protein H9P43_000123 [Blastocladiella emersonii ATCC 22665]|nr:hypothetical protein H9P43_000123 [Blastocladiella emersonii ATCC 22665]